MSILLTNGSQFPAQPLTSRKHSISVWVKGKPANACLVSYKKERSHSRGKFPVHSITAGLPSHVLEELAYQGENDVSPAPAPQGADNTQERQTAGRLWARVLTIHWSLTPRTCQRSAVQKHLNAAREARGGFEELAAQQPRLRDGEAVAHVLSGESRWRRQPWLRR